MMFFCIRSHGGGEKEAIERVGRTEQFGLNVCMRMMCEMESAPNRGIGPKEMKANKQNTTVFLSVVIAL